MNATLPFGILLFLDSDPDAVVIKQTGVYDSQEALLAGVDMGLKHGNHKLTDGTLHGYVQNEADAMAIQAAVKGKYGEHIRMFQLNQNNIYSIMR